MYLQISNARPRDWWICFFIGSGLIGPNRNFGRSETNYTAGMGIALLGRWGRSNDHRCNQNTTICMSDFKIRISPVYSLHQMQLGVSNYRHRSASDDVHGLLMCGNSPLNVNACHATNYTYSDKNI